MSSSDPIGIFDSGLGGLSVLASLFAELPYENFVYFADSAWCPYGSRSTEEIQMRSIAITQFLLTHNVKAVVVACNTATAAAIDLLRGTFPIPFIGIEPAIKQAALHTQSGKVGVLATRNTFQGRLYQETSARFANDKQIHVQIGDGLVELVEEDRIETPEAEALIRRYIEPMIASGVDQIVLGCTHYPFLISQIQKIVPPGVIVHNPAPAVARQTHRILENESLLAVSHNGKSHFFSSGDVTVLNRMIKRLVPESKEAIRVTL